MRARPKTSQNQNKLWLIDLGILTSFYIEKKEMPSGSIDNNSVISCAQFQPLLEGVVCFKTFFYSRVKLI